MSTPKPPSPQDQRRGGERGSYRSGFFFGTLSFLGTAVLGFVSTIVTARIYGVEIIGEFTLAIAPAGILFVLSTVKEQQALIREIADLPPRHPRVTQLFAAVFTFSWGLTAFVASLDVVACWFLFHGPLDQPELFAPAAVSVLGYVLVTNTGWNFDTIFSAFVAGRQLFWIRLCEAGAFIAIAVGLGLGSKSVWSLVIATIGASLVALLLRAAMLRQFLHARISWGEYRVGLGDLPGLLPFGLRATPGQMAQGVSQQAGVWALGLVGSTTMVGAYSRAISIPQRLQQASLRVTEVLYPTLVGRHSQGDGHGFDRALVDSIRYEVIGMLLLAATIGGAAHSVLQIFGPGFDKATTALALLALYPALASITVAQTQALWAVDRPGTTSVISIARMALTIGLLIVLTPALGITGPAVSLLAGYAAGVVFCGIALRPFLSRRLRATWPIRERLAVLVAYGAGFLAAHSVEHLVPSTFGTLLALIAGTAVYVPVFALCGGLNRRDRGRLRQLLARVRPPRSAAAQADPA